MAQLLFHALLGVQAVSDMLALPTFLKREERVPGAAGTVTSIYVHIIRSTSDMGAHYFLRPLYSDARSKAYSLLSQPLQDLEVTNLLLCWHLVPNASDHLRAPRG